MSSFRFVSDCPAPDSQPANPLFRPDSSVGDAWLPRAGRGTWARSGYRGALDAGTCADLRSIAESGAALAACDLAPRPSASSAPIGAGVLALALLSVAIVLAPSRR